MRSRLSWALALGLYLLAGVTAGSAQEPAAAERTTAEPGPAEAGAVDGAAAESEPPARGEIVDPVVCAADAELSYALYLPTVYTPERPWPALFILDARGRGAMVAERFRLAAERYGWVLVSSNDSASDAGWEEMARPAAAILADAPRRVRIDPRRVYLAGFSGTARGAVAITANAAGEVAGVIAVGGGFPQKLEPSAELPFAFFGSAGTRDFNFQEMQSLWDELDAASAVHRLAVFDGPHAWPPAEVTDQALGWFEVDAMRRGRRPVDEARALAWARDDAERWRQAEEAGDAWTAWTGWRALTRDLEGLDGEAIRQTRADAAVAAERLSDTRELDRARALRRRVARFEADRRGDVERIVGPIAGTDSLPPPDTRARAERLIRSLQKTAADEPAAPAEADAAHRVLAHLGSHVSFYMPRDLFARGEYQRAALSLELATAIRPDSVRSWYDLGCARARLGQRSSALDALGRAVELGYGNAEHLRSDPDLESLREDDRFRALAAELEERRAPTANG